MLTALVALVLAHTPVVSGPTSETLTERAERYCIEPDGDHRLTWHLAERDGFTLLYNAD